MKKLLLFTFLISINLSFAQETNPKYDAELAKKLGGDDYGMKAYVLVILKSGSNESKDSKLIDSCFIGHMSNINHLIEKGKMVVAGPISENDNAYRGIFILNVRSIEEAKSLLSGDPAISSELLSVALYEWYGPAALTEYLESSEKIWKKKL